MAGLKVITPPAAEPVDLNTDIKPQLRIDADDASYDDILTPLIVAAREWCEGYQNRSYITQTLELALDMWPCGNDIELPRPPLQSVTSIVYTDDEGQSATFDVENYVVDDYSFVARIVRARGVCWPSVCLPSANGIKIRYIAGYGTSDDVPRAIKQAIILIVCHWFDNGMCDPPPAAVSLLNLDRVVPI